MIHARKKVHRIGPAIVIFALLVGGISAFWFGLRAFRAHAEEQEKNTDTVASKSQNAKNDVENAPALATVFSYASGGDIGRVSRVINGDIATLDILVALSGIDTVSSEYHVWLVKDGLADVVDMGALTPRADGTWVGVFLAGPATGVIDPKLFSEVVIMLEPRDDNPAPSGVKVGEGSFQ